MKRVYTRVETRPADGGWGSRSTAGRCAPGQERADPAEGSARRRDRRGMGRTARRNPTGDDAADPARCDRDRPHRGAGAISSSPKPPIMPTPIWCATAPTTRRHCGASARGVAGADRLGGAALWRGTDGRLGGGSGPATPGDAHRIRRDRRRTGRVPPDRAPHIDRDLRLAGHRARALDGRSTPLPPSPPRSSTRPSRSRPGARTPKPPPAARPSPPRSKRLRGFWRC